MKKLTGIRRIRKIVPRNKNGSYTLYDDNDGSSVTLAFIEEPDKGFRVVLKALPDDLPEGYKWHFSFGVQDADWKFLPKVSYKLRGTGASEKAPWRVYYSGKVRELNGEHTSPGDPAVGNGKP